jgi:hypothetical protein
LIVPRSEVVASWPKESVAVERIQRSIHPRRDFFTAFPPKNLLLLWSLLRPFFVICANRSEPFAPSLWNLYHFDSQEIKSKPLSATD